MSERFLAGGWRIPAAAFLAVAMPLAGLYQLARPADWSALAAALSILLGCAFIVLGGVFASAFVHRRRPVVEVGADALELGSIYPFGVRQRVPLADVERIDLVGARLQITLRSGQVIRRGLAELPGATRRAAREAIERRLERR